MSDITNKRANWIRIEFWAITTIFAFAIFFFIMDGVEEESKRDAENSRYKHLFDAAKIRFNYYENYLIPQLINHIVQAIFVLLMNFVLVPRLLKKEVLLLLNRGVLLRNIFFTLLLFAAAGIVFGITGTYQREYLYAKGLDRDEVTFRIFRDGFITAWLTVWLLIIYTAIKYAGIYLLAISEKIEAKYRFIRKEAIVATVIWVIILFFLRIAPADREMIIGWLITGPTAILLYLASFYRLIPRALARNKYQFLSYLFTCAFILFLAFIVIFFLFVLITGGEDAGNAEAGAGFSAFNSFFQLFVTVPVTWVLYKRHMKGNEEIRVLQKELKQSTASVDLLRSQINPHFLFNALNTLYGTAIQEKADRTSEGIQMLGDMMRFMLHENMQEKISLTREIDYLKNYIALQKLRTDVNPGITIHTQIDDHINGLQIAPMLLIPFVENAFKHGISFREPSYIKVTLEVKDKTLNFDVSNSSHTKWENDPEKNKSGIGLENVKQRLLHVYPKNTS